MAEEETQKDILEFEASKALEDITNQLQNQSSDEDDFDFEKDVTSEGKVIGKEPLTLNKEKREKKASEMACEDELPGSRKEVTALATDVDVLEKRDKEDAVVPASSSSSLGMVLTNMPAHKKTSQVLIIYGPLGGTKNILARRLVAESPDLFTRVISHTTRQPLAGEVDGQEYYFIDNDEFQSLVDSNEMIEHTTIVREKLTAAGRSKYKKASMESLDDQIVEEHNHYGITFQALDDARRVGNSCVVMVLDMDGAKYWQEKPQDPELTFTYVFVRSIRTVCSPVDQFHAKIVVEDPGNAFQDLKMICLKGVRHEGPFLRSPLLAALAEWEHVDTVQPGLAGSCTPIRRSSLVTFAEVLAYFQSADLSKQMVNIRPTEQHGGLSAVRHVLFGPPKLRHSLHKERDLIFAIALFGFDNSQTLHNRILQTIYRKLTGTNFDCSRFGSHWQLVGFQGSDPITDLRGTGFLGLVHLLCFLMEARTHSLALEIFKLSQDEVQHFPFCAMSINITRIALQSLREGALSKECNSRGEVIGVVNEFYISIFFHLFVTWKQQHKTFSEAGFVLKDIEVYARKHSRKLFHQLRNRLLANDNKQSFAQPSALESHSSVDFTSVCDLDPTDSILV
ncbi:uncharacterized protein LOC134181132 [Corticium candelabrum]|uniref:uncharacterized protein LOC134181132 n=1 Tax=Corticium candelabrum TaxID=121492 RepID=UPI002E25255E|nr:uncharacterized protein LOC134181132 [Corticium candelabrum]